MTTPIVIQASNSKLQTPSSKRQTPSSERQTPSVKRQTPGSKRQTPSVKRQTPSTKRCPSRLPYYSLTELRLLLLPRRRGSAGLKPFLRVCGMVSFPDPALSWGKGSGEEKRAMSPDTFPRERAGSGNETRSPWDSIMCKALLCFSIAVACNLQAGFYIWCTKAYASNAQISRWGL